MWKTFFACNCDGILLPVGKRFGKQDNLKARKVILRK